MNLLIQKLLTLTQVIKYFSYRNILTDKLPNKNFTSKNKENYHSNILSNGNNIPNHQNDKSMNNGSTKSSPRKNMNDNETHNLNIKLDELIRHLKFFEIFFDMELVNKRKIIIYIIIIVIRIQTRIDNNFENISNIYFRRNFIEKFEF